MQTLGFTLAFVLSLPALAAACSSPAPAPAGPGPSCTQASSNHARDFTVSSGSMPVSCVSDVPIAADSGVDAGAPDAALPDGGLPECCAALCALEATRAPASLVGYVTITSCSAKVVLGLDPVLHCEWRESGTCGID